MRNWRWHCWSLDLLGERGDTGVRAELGGWSRVSTGVGVDSDGRGRIQSATESVGRGAIELALDRLD